MIGTKKLTSIILSVCLVGIYLITQLPYVTEPFWGHHEFNGVFYGTIARNYHSYGLLQTKGAQITTGYPDEPSNWNFHTHHPATYPLLLYGWTLVFPLNEWSLRTLSMVFSVGAFLYWLYQHQQSRAQIFAAGTAILMVLLTPLFRYYSSLPVFEPIMLPFFLIGLLAFHRRNLRLAQVMIVILALIDWPGYWFGLWILILSATAKNKRWFLQTLLALGLTTAIITGLQTLAYGHPLTAFWDIGAKRLATTNQPYTLVEWSRLLISRTKSFLGLPGDW